MVNTDVSLTLLVAMRLGLDHPILSWFRLHGAEACYSELLRDELRDMERRGKLCPGDAQATLDLLRSYGLREEPARVGWARRAALRLLFNEELPDRMLNDAKLAYHAAALKARLVSYNERDYERLSKHISSLVYVKPPGTPLAYRCQDGQAGQAVQGRSRERSRKTSKTSQAPRRAKRESHRSASRRTIQAERGRGRGQAKRTGQKSKSRKREKSKVGRSLSRKPSRRSGG